MTDPIRPGPSGSVDIDVLVVPRASRGRVVGLHGDRVKIQVTSAPVEGAANQELLDVLAAYLQVPKRNLEVVRGTTGRRKTVRACGLDLDLDLDRLRGRFGLPLVLVGTLLASTSCEPATIDVPVRLVLPADASDLDRVDNVSLSVMPGDQVETYPVSGLDFTLQIALEPTETPQRLAVYLAEGKNLLAWGQSPAAQLSALAELAVFVGRPGALSGFPALLSAPDAGTMAAAALGRGIVLLESDGRTYLLNDYTLGVSAGESLPQPPAIDDGTFVSDALGGVVRIAWNQGLKAWRFDPAADEWLELHHVGADAVGPRQGAAHVADAARKTVIVLGGGDETDAVAIDLVPDEHGKVAVRPVSGIVLDYPRRGATASWILRSDTDLGEGILLHGGDDSAFPTVFLAGLGGALGPSTAWTDSRCVPLDRGMSAQASSVLRVFCGGGVRDDTPTDDALLVRVPPPDSDPPAVEEMPGFFPAPMPDLRWFEDSGAVYAQHAERWVRVSRTDPAAMPFESAAKRERGGTTVVTATGATLLVGGIGPADAPLERWFVFTPDIPLP